ncbi:MAG: energy-coupling factor transporter ATPase [Chloroflexota bacterium]
MTKIRLENLSIQYFGSRKPVIKHVDLSFKSGETVLLLGASGSGKSTLALALNGLIPHALPAKMDGHVYVDELNTQSASTGDLSQKVGIVFQDPEAQFVTLKVEDELLFGLENLKFSPESMSETVDSALKEVGLPEFRQRGVDQLSGGQKQRIALASLLAMRPQVLIFDEPTANLDPVGTEDVFALLGEIKAKSGHSIILIEHKLDSLIHLIDRVIILGPAGSILADGLPREIFYEEGELLQTHGIWMPEITRLARALHATNRLPRTIQPLTMGEMVAALDRFERENEPFLDQPERAEAYPENAPLLEITALTHAYGQTPVLKEVSLSIFAGEFLALVGANGAGKTTLAQHMIGVLQPERGMGEITLGGKRVGTISSHQLSNEIGYVFQNPEHQFITNSVYDEIAYGLRVAGLDEEHVKNKTEGLLQQFKLDKDAERSPFTLSHGEKRRLSVATMLAMGQEMLILDEPTFGQDHQNAVAIMSLLQALNQSGKTIVMITHDMHLVAEYASRAAVMVNGRIIFTGAPAELFSQGTVLDQANLKRPPISELAAQLSPQKPAWSRVHTLDEALRLLKERST